MKTLTVENWLKADPFMNGMHAFSHLPEGFNPKYAERWVNEILRVSINKQVPEEIQNMFAIARGLAVYGLFFAPLYTIADEQLYRIAERAISLKCIQKKAPKKLKYMYNKLEWLADNKIISAKEKTMWDIMREFRNAGSHESGKYIFWPTPVGNLKRIAHDIEALFLKV